MSNFARFTPLVAASLVSLTPALVIAREFETKRVQFRPGATSQVIEASIRGDDIVDYILNARAGQVMNVSMATNNTANYFNIIPPGEKKTAIFNGSIDGNQFEKTLTQSGDYKIRVYLMRSAARRGETANYRLEMIISALE